MIYLDTSLLVKLYVPEPDSPSIVDAIHVDSQIVLSDLAQVEFASAVARLVRESLLGKARGRDLLRRLDADWERFFRVQVSDAVIEESRSVLKRHALRTLDALQLGTALVVGRSAPSALRFGTADRCLARAAEAEGLPPLLTA